MGLNEPMQGTGKIQSMNQTGPEACFRYSLTPENVFFFSFVKACKNICKGKNKNMQDTECDQIFIIRPLTEEVCQTLESMLITMAK